MLTWTQEFEYVLASTRGTAVGILVGWLHSVYVPEFEPGNNLPILTPVRYNHLRAGRKQ